MDEPPIVSAPTGVPPRKSNPRQVAYGFATGVGLFALAYLPPPGPKLDNFAPFMLAITVLPFAALVLAIIRPTRIFGLGLVLACGIIWLVMLAICGGTLLSTARH